MNKQDIFFTILIGIAVFMFGSGMTEISYRVRNKTQAEIIQKAPQAARQLEPHQELLDYFPDEYSIILKAAERNGLADEQTILLFAIRKSENGPSGNEFGVMTPYAKNTNLDRQAGACAFEIARHVPIVNEASILQFADRYCPKSVDPVGNENWKKNVTFWYYKLGGE